MKAKTKTDPRAALADEYGRLDAELAPLRPKLKRFEALGKLLRVLGHDEPDDRPVEVAGAEYEVTLSASGWRSIVAPNGKLYKRLGKDTFLAVATVTIKALMEAVHPALVAELVRAEQSGPRRIEVQAKETVAKAA
ncbi:MAG: hypothetical protein ACRD19_15040 [Terriglobia bacterium]